ncbi:MAG: enoyl-CoA hydratase-related protein [Betaproteobacteria bacterium]|nr:enoyl-CoA hydratase-related protein [Betaproteobacteria bacterium]MDH5341812.1 enoyl-CoA hydratase-related protein [Betaproteobacteria bacterium]
MTSESDPVILSRDGAIATVTLNNPAKLNALTKAMWTRLGETMRLLSDNDALRCIVLRGAGDKAFAAGADIAEFATERANARQAKLYGEVIHSTMQAVAQCRHPTVALIQGACVGGGLEIAAMCDMRICGTSSRFGVPINKLGLTMAYGELAGLLALVGRATTLEILLEGRVFDAEEAYRKRLVNRVVADDRVETESYALAQRIANGAPLVARWHKQFIERLTVQADIAPEEWDVGFACFDTEDYREGVKAFLGKSKPAFRGR